MFSSNGSERKPQNPIPPKHWDLESKPGFRHPLWSPLEKTLLNVTNLWSYHDTNLSLASPCMSALFTWSTSLLLSTVCQYFVCQMDNANASKFWLIPGWAAQPLKKNKQKTFHLFFCPLKTKMFLEWVSQGKWSHTYVICS